MVKVAECAGCRIKLAVNAAERGILAQGFIVGRTIRRDEREGKNENKKERKTFLHDYSRFFYLEKKFTR